MRTVWLANGSSITADVTKVEKGGIHINSPQAPHFISASELSMADRVHYGFGTRKETAWAARVTAYNAKHPRSAASGSSAS